MQKSGQKQNTLILFSGRLVVGEGQQSLANLLGMGKYVPLPVIERILLRAGHSIKNRTQRGIPKSPPIDSCSTLLRESVQ